MIEVIFEDRVMGHEFGMSSKRPFRDGSGATGKLPLCAGRQSITRAIEISRPREKIDQLEIVRLVS